MVLPTTTYVFDSHFTNMSNTSLDPAKMTTVAASPYVDILGSIFWGIVFAVVFLMIFLRSEDVTIPSLLGLLIGSSLWLYMPSDWTAMAMSLTVVSMAGIMFSLIKGRQ